MGVRRLVRVEAVIECPPGPPWIGDLPYPEPVESRPGTMLDWRWIDKRAGTRIALVQYRRDSPTYLGWVSGELLVVDLAEPLTEATGTGRFAAMEPDEQAHDGIASNDDEGLEREAEVMGASASSDGE